MGISFAPDWGEGNILSLFRGVDVPLEPGMVFHVPITLREYNKWTVAVSETVMVTEKGPQDVQHHQPRSGAGLMPSRQGVLTCSTGPQAPRNVPEPDIALAERLFDILTKETADTAGVTRAAYGKGEQFAHDLVIAEAQKVGLPTSVDAGGNLYVRLAGIDAQSARQSSSGRISTPFRWAAITTARPACLTGLAVIVAWQKAGFRLARRSCRHGRSGQKRATGFRIPISGRNRRSGSCRPTRSTCGARTPGARSPST